MKIIFFGATELGFDCCEYLLDNGIEISGIFTIPEKFNIKYKGQGISEVKNVLYKDFNELGKRYKIPVFEVNRNIEDYWHSYQDLEPDFCLLIGWYYNIPKKFTELSKKGIGAIHASLLPKYRGNSPLVWAMINGEKNTGVTFFQIDEGIDTGDIFGQSEFNISKEDTIRDLLEYTKQHSKSILLECIPKIADGSIVKRKQNKNKNKVYPKRQPSDGLIDWTKNNIEIENFIRAQTKPYPGAYTIINNKKVIIWDANIEEL